MVREAGEGSLRALLVLATLLTGTPAMAQTFPQHSRAPMRTWADPEPFQPPGVTRAQPDPARVACAEGVVALEFAASHYGRLLRHNAVAWGAGKRADDLWRQFATMALAFKSERFYLAYSMPRQFDACLGEVRSILATMERQYRIARGSLVEQPDPSVQLVSLPCRWPASLAHVEIGPAMLALRQQDRSCAELVTGGTGPHGMWEVEPRETTRFDGPQGAEQPRRGRYRYIGP